MQGGRHTAGLATATHSSWNFKVAFDEGCSSVLFVKRPALYIMRLPQVITEPTSLPITHSAVTNALQHCPWQGMVSAACCAPT